MNTKQENILSMYYGFREFVDAQLETANQVPFFAETYRQFESAYEAILNFRVVQEGDTSGVAQDKAALRKQLEAETMELSKQLVAWAAVRKNHTLYKKVVYTASDLTRATDTGFRDVAELIFMLANENLNDLAIYEVTVERLANFRKSIDRYSASIGKPRQSLNERANATEQIERLFDEAEERLELMDKLVEASKKKFPDFYNSYCRATKVVQLGSKSLALRANAKDAHGNPLANVIFEITSHQLADANARLSGSSFMSTTPTLVKRTTDNGNFQVQNLADGIYRALVKKTGYQDQEVTFHVAKGELLDLDVTLQKV